MQSKIGKATYTGLWSCWQQPGHAFSQAVRMRVGDVQRPQSRLLVPVSRKGRGAKSGTIAVAVGKDVLDALLPAVTGRAATAPLLERWRHKQVTNGANGTSGNVPGAGRGSRPPNWRALGRPSGSTPRCSMPSPMRCGIPRCTRHQGGFADSAGRGDARHQCCDDRAALFALDCRWPRQAGGGRRRAVGAEGRQSGADRGGSHE